jgi:hypothetical protein
MQREFSFHACLGPDVSQAEVMELVGLPQLLDAALSGYHVCIFAYGQTGEPAWGPSAFHATACVRMHVCWRTVLQHARMVCLHQAPARRTR